MGIEPTSEAWEASILPLYDARSFSVYGLYITVRLLVQTVYEPFRIFQVPAGAVYLVRNKIAWSSGHRERCGSRFVGVPIARSCRGLSNRRRRQRRLVLSPLTKGQY